MRIIVEGPNNVGKSTFIDNMMRDIPELREYEIEHVCSNCPNDAAFHKDLLHKNANIILDRFYIGELVYPKLFNRQQRLSRVEAIELFREYSDTIIIFIDADIAFIEQSCNNKKEVFDYSFVEAEKDGFNDMYKLFYTTDSSRVFKLKNHKDAQYIYSKYSYAEVIASLMECLEKEKKK